MIPKAIQSSEEELLNKLPIRDGSNEKLKMYGAVNIKLLT